MQRFKYHISILVLKTIGENHLDRLCEKWRSVT